MPVDKNFKTLPGEEWTPISGYETRYLISNHGRVKSIISLDNCDRDGVFILSQYCKRRYCTCVLVSDTRKDTMLVHRLVAFAFVNNSNPNELTQVNHIDANKHNNHYSNLEWCTHRQNDDHAIKHGLKPRQKGILNGHAKLSEDDVRLIRVRHKEGSSIADLAREFGLVYVSIKDIIIRKNWSHIL